MSEYLFACEQTSITILMHACVCIGIFMLTAIQCQVFESDLEANYEILREYLIALGHTMPKLPEFEVAFTLLSISLNIHGETVYHMRGGKGKCRET